MAGLLDGVLPYIFSRSDALKRQFGGLLSDPRATINQAVNHANDRAGGLLSMTAAATDEGLRYGPATERLTNAMADAYNPMGMALLKTDGLTNRGKELVQGEAERLAKLLRAQGFQPSVTHSGSAAGPSSYLQAFDPTTGRIVLDNLRFSGHSKGPWESQFVRNIDSTQFDDLLKEAQSARNLGPSTWLVDAQEREAKFAAKAAAKKSAELDRALERALAKVQAGETLSRREELAYQAYTKYSNNP